MLYNLRLFLGVKTVKKLAIYSVICMLIAGLFGCSPQPEPVEQPQPMLTGTYIASGPAREKPETDSAAVFSVKAGQEVRVAHDGVTTEWVKVITDNEEGWLPAEYFVQDGKQLVAPVIERLEQLLASAGDIETALYLTEELELLLPLLPTREADTVFRKWQDKILDLLPAVEHAVNSSALGGIIVAEGADIVRVPELISDQQARQLLETLLAAGFAPGSSEGMIYVAPNPDTLIRFSDALSEPLQEYAQMLSQAINRPWAMDAALMIPWDEVRARAMAAEQWLAQNAELPEAAEVETWLNRLMGAYLRGMDNSPLFPFGTNTLDPDLKTSYETFLEINKQSRYYEDVRQLYDLLKQHRFERTAEVEAYLYGR